MTEVMVVSSSPRMEKSTTHYILRPFIDGMESAGAEVKIFYTIKMKINPCFGDFFCWTRHPGRCYQEDDMQQIYPIIKSFDYIVLSTPLYVDGFSGSMKMFLDRLIPTVSPFIRVEDNRCRHLLPQGRKRIGIVLVSSCGYWEKENFEVLVAHTQAICENLHADFKGALLRPHGAIIPAMAKRDLSILYKDVIEAAKESGVSLIKNGKMDEKLLETVSRPLINREEYVKNFNRYFEKKISETAKKEKS